MSKNIAENNAEPMVQETENTQETGKKKAKIKLPGWAKNVLIGLACVAGGAIGGTVASKINGKRNGEVEMPSIPVLVDGDGEPCSVVGELTDTDVE